MSKKQLILMGLLCLIPVVALGVIFLFRLPVSSVVLLALALACPISHLLMMASMGHGQAEAQHDNHLAMPRK